MGSPSLARVAEHGPRVAASPHTPMMSVNSFTAAADFSRAACSSAKKSSPGSGEKNGWSTLREVNHV